MDEILDLEPWEAKGVWLLVERLKPETVTLRRCAAGGLRLYANDANGEIVGEYDVVRTPTGTIGANIVDTNKAAA